MAAGLVYQQEYVVWGQGKGNVVNAVGLAFCNPRVSSSAVSSDVPLFPVPDNSCKWMLEESSGFFGAIVSGQGRQILNLITRVRFPVALPDPEIAEKSLDTLPTGIVFVIFIR